jgi:hypothetical protein
LVRVGPLELNAAQVRLTWFMTRAIVELKYRIPAGRVLAYFEILLSLPPLVLAAIGTVIGFEQTQWVGHRGGRATVGGGLLLAGVFASVLLVPAIILLSRWRYRWWPQLVPLGLFSTLAVFLATHWNR